MDIKEKISALLEELNSGIYEKEEVIRLALLSAVAGESIFLLGPPGTAKSLIARRLKYAFAGKDGRGSKGAAVFEYLMSRFSTPDEIFGPVAISKLKEDKYERVVDRYLPTAEVVFLDEIWKAGPSIQNALLTIVNEKVFRNGETEINVPMKALIAASNELPAKGEGLEALWDRFLVRLVVEGIENREIFNKMISEDTDLYSDTVSAENKITDDEYREWSKRINEVRVPDNVLNVIHFIRNYIAEHNQPSSEEEPTENQMYVSDRRWRKIVRLLRTSAFLNDRKEVDLMDCFLIQHCIWNDAAQIDTATHQFVRDAIEEHGYTVAFDFTGIREEIEEFKTEIAKETVFVKESRQTVLANVRKDYYEVVNPPDQRGNLIRQVDFNKLTNTNQGIYLSYWHDSYQQVQNYSHCNMRKGNSKFSIFINDTEYKLKTVVKKEKRQTHRPNAYTENAWDGRVDAFVVSTSHMKNEIEKYQQKDLAHLRTNLFVAPELANVVESHIAATVKEIEKIELEVWAIQNAYKNLKDEEVVVND